MVFVGIARIRRTFDRFAASYLQEGAIQHIPEQLIGFGPVLSIPGPSDISFILHWRRPAAPRLHMKPRRMNLRGQSDHRARIWDKKVTNASSHSETEPDWSVMRRFFLASPFLAKTLHPPLRSRRKEARAKFVSVRNKLFSLRIA
jgi:hypothetical protein